MNLVSIADLSAADIESIWNLAHSDAPGPALTGTAAWSFEGHGVRTRATFIQAFRELGLAFTELPSLLKTAERAEDLAGYLDPFFSCYVIRESNHDKLAAFARASSRPVVNAMSGLEHPCEVLADALYIDRFVKPLREATICLWGPTTNVFRSWHALARLLGLRVVQVCDRPPHTGGSGVEFRSTCPAGVDVVITDAWPRDLTGEPTPLAEEHLSRMGRPALLPTPPFTVGRELLLDPLEYPGFTGYAQKRLLLPVHKAVLRHLAGAVPAA